MKKLEAQIQKLIDFLPVIDKINLSVSDASVAWHIEHSLLVIKQITATVAQSDPSLYQRKFNFKRSWVFLLNYIPRGKAKAPKSVIPGTELNLKALEESVAHTYQAMNYLKDCQPNQYFMHPFFGALNQRQTIRFLSIHTKHHLKIIRDIVG
jgi:hypothetical protein